MTKKNLKEEIAWQGFGTGEVDAILENWGHDDLKKKYIDRAEDRRRGRARPATRASSAGTCRRGWPRQYPDITDWKNLNKYAAQFKTSESGGKGQLLDGDPSYVTNDEALVKNLKLNFKVVYAGSETALIQAFRQAEKNKKPVLGYFYEPQWFLSEVQAGQGQPAARTTPGCDADPAKVACDYPPYDLDKIVSKKFADSGSPALRPGEELQVDQRGPERGRPVHRRGQDDRRRRRRRSGSTPTPTRSTPGSSSADRRGRSE